MKVLIWIGCIFANAIINVMFKSAGIILGAIPATALFCFFMWLARRLCQIWDEYKSHETKRKKKSSNPNNPKKEYECKNCGYIGQYDGACPKCGRLSKVKVEQKNTYEPKNNPTHEKINEVSTHKIIFCRKCGEKLIDDSEFCSKCGTKIK